MKKPGFPVLKPTYLTTENFYFELPVHTRSLSKLTANSSLFYNVPEDWHILVADIKNSTQAILDGKHQQVNLVATGSVIAILNLAAEKNITIPFFFGGDGATMLVPPALLSSGISALKKHKINTLKNFDFDLKIGHVSLEEVYKKGMHLKIARARINAIFNIPVVLGNGLQYAETLIKNNPEQIVIPLDNYPLNLDGMECKWDRIKPPKEHQEVISLIVGSHGEEDPSKSFSKVLKAIDEIYGSPRSRKPISVKRLKLNAKWGQINLEMRTKIGKFNGLYLVKNWLRNNIGKIYFSYSDSGKNYLEKLVELTDTITIDGRINTVITGNAIQRSSLVSYLDHLEKTGKITYGLQVSQESVMSCYVKDMASKDHIHFVDGADGGYTKAANNLKEKLSL